MKRYRIVTTLLPNSRSQLLWRQRKTIGEGCIFVIDDIILSIDEIRERRVKLIGDKPRLSVVFENGTESSIHRESPDNFR